MHTHRRADSCQRAAVLHRGRRVKTRPALGSGSGDVAAQVLVLHQLAQVLVDVGAVDGDGAARVGRLEAQRVEQAFEHGVQAAGTDVLLALVTWAAISARRSTASGANDSETPSVFISSTYWRVSEALGSVRMRTKSSLLSALSSTRIGKQIGRAHV